MTSNVTVYGATDCEETRRVREYLAGRGTNFEFVNIDEDKEAEEMVKKENDGKRRTPLVIVQFGTEARVLRVPSNEEVEDALRDLEPLERTA